MGHGTHGSTYGGNPLACTVGNSVLDILDKKFIDDLLLMAAKFRNQILEVIEDYPEIIEGIRGKGLMLGLKCKVENTKFVEIARINKLLTIKASGNVVRLLPPLNISDEDGEEAIKKIRATCKQLN